MKKLYTLLVCTLLFSTGLFAQTNLLLNSTFTSGDDWRGDAVGVALEQNLGHTIHQKRIRPMVVDLGK